MPIFRRIIMALATGAGVGYAPKAPGTLGTLAAIPLALVVGRFDGVMAWGATIAFTCFSIGVAHLAAQFKEQHDPQCVVIDEMAGYLITVTGHSLSTGTIIVGFVLFRLFDITKPGPVGWCDRHLKGGLGIVMDDALAGGFSNLCLWGLVYLNKSLLNISLFG